MSITRIQNNQITDSTIVAYAKLQTGSLTGNLFAPTVTLNSNVTINGNLFLANTGNTTTINATNTYINDPLVVYNNGYAGSLSGYDIGMVVNRNLTTAAPYGSVNAAWVWVEDDKAFESIMTTDTGTGATSINNSGYANVKLGNTTLVSASVSGGITAASYQGAIGSVTPSTAAFTTLAASGVTQLTNATENNNLAYSSGALQVTGGAGIGANLFVGGNLTVSGNVYSSTGNINVVTVTGNNGQFFGNAAGFGALYTGISTGYVYQPQTVLQNSTNFNGYAQVNHQNINSGPLASGDYVATADNGTADNTYIDMGIASSTYNYPGFGLIRPNDGYLLVYGNTTTGGGNLLLATSAQNDIIFATNGFNSVNEYGRINDANVFVIRSSVASSSTSTGAMTIAGGLGVAGAVYAGSLYDNGNRVLTSFSSSGAGNVTVSVSNPTSSTVALTATGPGAAQWGGTTQLPYISTDVYGRVSAAGNIALNTVAVTEAGNTSEITANASTGKVGFNLTTTGVAAGTYGGASTIPTIVVDSKGRVTSVTTNAASTSFTVAGTSGSTTIDTGATLTLAGTYGVTVSVGATYANIGTPQDLRSTANPTFNNLVGASFQGVIGNVTPSAGAFTTISASGASTLNTITGASFQGVIGNVTPASGAFTSLTSSTTAGLNTVTAASYQGVIGNVTPAAGTFTTGAFNTATVGGLQAVAIGNVTPGTAVFTTATTGGLQAVAIGNVTPGTGAFTSLNSSTTAALNTVTAASYQGKIGNATPNTGEFTSLTSSTTAGLNTVTAASYQGKIGNATPNTGAFTTLAASGTSTLDTVTAASFQGVIGNVTPSTGAFTSLNSSTTAALNTVTGASFQGKIGNAAPNTGAFTTLTASGVTQVTDSTQNNGTTYTSGALQVTGGAGFGGNVYIAGNLVVSGNVYETATEIITGNEIVAGVITANSGTASTSTTTGALLVNGGAGVTGAVYAGSFQGVIGSVAPAAGYHTTLSATGATTLNTATGASFQGVIGNVTPAAGTFTALTATTSAALNTLTAASFQGVIGNVTPNTGAFTSITAQTETVGGLQAVAIGNVTPGTGAFTTLTTSGTIIGSGNIVAAASTASTGVLTGALVVPTGGVGIRGNLNAGTINSSIHQLFGNLVVGYGNGATGATSTLVINQNNATPFNTTSVLHVFGEADKSTKIAVDSVGTLASSLVIARKANGTAASPTALLNGEIIGGFIGRGYGSSGFSLQTTGNSAGILFTTTQNFTDTAQGTSLRLNVIPNDSNIAITAANINHNGDVTLAYNTTVNGNLVVNQYTQLAKNVTVQANAYVTGTIHIANGTPTTSSTTGALVVDGGAAIFGNINTDGQLFVGAQSQNSQLTNAIAVERGTSSTGAGAQYTQHAVINGTDTGSSDIIAYADDYVGPSDDHGWADMGFTGASFDDPVYSITKAHDAYLFGSGPKNYGGNLVLATDWTGTYNDIVLGVGSFYSNSEVARFHGNTSNGGYLNLQYTSSASSSTNGALRVQGGVGISGALYTAGLGQLGAGLQNTPIGNATPSTAAFTTLSASGATSLNTITGASFQGVIGNVTPAAATFTTVTANTETVGGLQAVAIGNVTPGTAAFTTATTNGLQAVAIGNVTPGTGAFTAATIGGLQAVAIGNVTPGTAAFTTLSATGASTLDTITGVSFQGIIGNTTAASGTFTTVSTGGLQAVAIGNVTPGSGAFTTLTTSSTIKSAGNIVVTTGTETVDTTTGALMLTGTGGAMIGGNAYVGKNLYIGANAFGRNLANPTIIAADSGANYAQMAMINTTATGSSDYAAYSDNGSDTGGWIDVGIAGSSFNDGNYTITKALDGYILTKPVSNSYGGNLILATSEVGAFNDIVIATGSFHANAEVARFHGNTSNSGYLNLAYTTNSGPAANTGALRVQGGASFASNVYVGGAVTLNGAQTSNYDFKVRGVGTTNLIWARPNTTYDTVIVGDTLAASSIVNGAKLYINSTDSMVLPVGTNSQRPGIVGGTTAVTGMLRYNTTSNGLEFYNGSSWQAPSSTITVITDQQFTATGSTAAFTLSSAATTASTIVSINGVLQIPTLAYSVSGTTLTFTENPANGDIIDVRVLTTTSTVSQLNDTSGFNSVQVAEAGATNGNTAILFTTGLLGGTAIQQYSIDTSGGFVTLSPNVTVSTASIATTVDNLFANIYSSAEYTITATMQGTNIRQIDKVHLIHSGDESSAGTATAMVYGTVNTAGNSLVTYSATTSGNIAILQATTTNNNTILRIKRNYQAI